MTTENPKAKEIFLEALDCESSEELLRYLDEACDGNANLRSRVEGLLRAHREVGNFLGGPPTADLSATEHVVVAEKAKTEILGDYRLIREIGRGGMGVVYEAEQISLSRRVALKLLPFTAVLDPRQLKRFQTEAQAAAALEHPHIVNVHNVGCERGVHYYAMQYVEGHDVADLIRQLRQLSEADLPATVAAGSELALNVASGTFEPPDITRRISLAEQPSSATPADEPDPLGDIEPPPSANDTRPMALFETKDCTNKREYFRTIAGLGIQAAEALHYAHQHGILHRDIKPSNLLLNTDGRLMVADFGLAQIEGHASLTVTGDVMGTLRYMSPEQGRGQNEFVDGRSDVYSLGVTLYEMLTLQPIFPECGRNELLQKQALEDPLAPRQVNKAIPADLELIVLKAIAKDPLDRYTTAQEFADDLQRYLENKPVLARKPTLARRIVKWGQRHRTLAVSFMMALVAGIVSAAIVVVIKDRDGKPVLTARVPAGGKLEIIQDNNTPTLVPIAESVDEEAEPVLPGLVPYPEKLPGVSRWQIITKRPNSRVHHFWQFDFSPDSRFIAFGNGHEVRVYSIPDFQLKRVLSGHTNSVIAVDWSPDGKLIASSSADNTVRIWDAATGVPGAVLVGHSDRIDTVDWHPDSHRLASGSRDGAVRIWHSDGTPGPVLWGRRHRGAKENQPVNSVAWSPDGAQLATVGNAPFIRLWNAAGEFQSAVKTQIGSIRSVEWSPNGRQLLTSHFGPHVARLSKADGTMSRVLKGHTDLVVSADWSHDGKQVLSSSWDNTIRIWNTDGTPKSAIRGHDGDVYCAKWSPDDRWIASGGIDRSIRLWSGDGQPGPVLPGHHSLNNVAWSPDGRSFAVGSDDDTIRIHDEKGVSQNIFDGSPGLGGSLAWSPDSRQIVYGSSDQSVRIWNINSGKVGPILKRHLNLDSKVSWNPNGRQIAYTSGGSKKHSVRIWNLDGTDGPIMDVPRKKIYEIAWNPLGDRLALVGIDGILRLWQSDGTEAGVFNVGSLIASVAWKSDGSQLACGCDDGTIHIWQPDGHPARMLKGHDARVNSLAWSDEGSLIASGGRDNTVRLWTDDGRMLAVLIGHTGAVRDVAWRPHTNKFLSCGQDATVLMWNAKTQRTEWMLLILGDKQSIKLSAAGRILAGDAEVTDRELIYLVEQPTGAVHLLKPSEFHQRTPQDKAMPTTN